MGHLDVIPCQVAESLEMLDEIDKEARVVFGIGETDVTNLGKTE